jgi:hypothetical protein
VCATSHSVGHGYDSLFGQRISPAAVHTHGLAGRALREHACPKAVGGSLAPYGCRGGLLPATDGMGQSRSW